MMLRDYFEDMAAGLQSRLAAEGDSPGARKMYALEVARLGARLYSGKQKVAWCGIAAPFDLLAAMGVTSCFVEFIGAMLAATGMIGEFMAAAHMAGYANDSCSYHRSVMGAALKGMMPEPDFLVATSCPCTGGLAAMENLAHVFGKKLFVLQVPQTDTAEHVRFLADQIRNLVDFVADHTGQPLDPLKLKAAITYTNQARTLMKDVYELAACNPSPASGKSLANFGIVMALLLGTPAGVQVAEAFKREFTTRVQENRAGVPGERLRLLWIQNRIQFKNPLIDLLETDYKAVIVTDELNTINWDPIDPDDPYTGLARRAISIPFNGPAARRIELLKDMARRFEIDGAINPCNWGCRQGTGGRGLIAEGLKTIGVPVLNLEVDCVDPQVFAEGQVRTRVEAFMEMLMAS